MVSWEEGANWMGVPAALFKGKPDEEPWISACGLDEGEG
jgi:hypothetical protein